MSEIKVSVVTVCLNAEEVIEKTIKSVLDQNYDNIEYIIVDGCSTDRTVEIVNQYKDGVSKICIEKDNGIYEAMNKGIRMATGELIGFMNAGDYYEEGAISAIVEKYNETSADILYGDAVLVCDGKETYKSHKNLCLERYFETNPIVHQSIFVKTLLHKKNEFDTNYKILSDYNFFIRQFVQGAKFQYVDKNISYYDMKGISSVETIQTAYESRNILINVANEYEDYKKKYLEKIENSFLFKMFLVHCTGLRQYAFYLNRIINDITYGYDKVVIFGVGYITDQVVDNIRMRFDYFVDNNKSLHGKTFKGKKVFSPVVLLGNPKEKIFVFISSIKYLEEIKEELKEMSKKADIDYMSIYQLGIEAEQKLYGINSYTL